MSGRVRCSTTLLQDVVGGFEERAEFRVVLGLLSEGTMVVYIVVGFFFHGQLGTGIWVGVLHPFFYLCCFCTIGRMGLRLVVPLKLAFSPSGGHSF